MTKIAIWWHKTTKGHYVYWYRSPVKTLRPIYKCKDCSWVRRP